MNYNLYINNNNLILLICHNFKKYFFIFLKNRKNDQLVQYMIKLNKNYNVFKIKIIPNLLNYVLSQITSTCRKF